MVTKKLISKCSTKPAEAARKMEITPAAITHCMKGSRGRAKVEAISSSRRV
ncbi:MAG: hypothetical protein ACUVTL_03410 [Thermoproteota archaeon]